MKVPWIHKYLSWPSTHH